jgi:putative aldouronate transport system substrate-binding protein
LKVSNLKRFLALTMAIILTMSVSACSTTKKSSSSTVSDTAPVTLTIGFIASSVTPGNGVHQDISNLAEITKRTGITLDFVTYDETKLSVLVAGGDLPDIIQTGNTSTAKVMMNASELLPLDSLLDNYGQNIKKNIPTALNWAKTIIGNGKTYFLPTNVTEANTSMLNYVGGANVFNSRYDVYKAIGSPKISDDDSFLSVLKQMQDYQRKLIGSKDIYAFSTWTDGGIAPFIVTYPFSYGYTNSANNQLISPTGKLESEFLNESGIFWQGIEFYNKAYRMGIFDPEGLTQKYAQYSAKVTGGKILSVESNYWTNLDPYNLGTNAILTVLPGSTKYISKIYSVDSLIGYGMAGARCINANCKYPKRAMELLNYLDTVDGARLVCNGVKGVEWNIVDGKAQIIGDYKAAVLSNSTLAYCNKNKLCMLGDNFINLINNYTSGASDITKATGQLIDLASSMTIKDAAASKAELSFANDFGTKLCCKVEVYDTWVKAGKAKTVTSYPLAASLLATASDSTAKTVSDAQAYFMANVSKVILAKDDISYNDAKAKMIQAFKDMGCAAADAEAQKIFADAQKVASSFKK